MTENIPQHLSHKSPRRVCALVPTFNRAHYLSKTLDSLLAQTLPLDEILVINDGSTDNTEEVVNQFCSPVRLITKQNGGKSSALNMGLRETTADYIWVCDDDDLALPHGLESLFLTLEAHPEADIAYGKTKIFIEEDPARTLHDPGYWKRIEEPNDKINFLESLFTNQFAMLVRRTLYEKVGPFREDLIRSQDCEMTLRLTRNAQAIGIDEVIYHYRHHSGMRGAQGSLFSAQNAAEKWTSFEKIIYQDVLKNYHLSEFTPSFALTDNAVNQQRAQYIQRAIILANRSLWQEAMNDLTSAEALLATPLSRDEIHLAESMRGRLLAWFALSNDQQSLRTARALYARSPVGKKLLLALCRPIRWQMRLAYSEKRYSHVKKLTGLLFALLGPVGFVKRLKSSISS